MIFLNEITEDNYLAVSKLKVSDEQIEFVGSPMRIMASAYAMRKRNARVYAISNEDVIVGALMVKDMDEEPACYALEHFMIDVGFQNRGFGTQALKLIINVLSKERKYKMVELCVKMKDEIAIRMYKNAGFIDTGYIDPQTPDSYIFSYTFT